MCYSIFGGIFSQPRLTTGCIVLKPQKNNVKKKKEKIPPAQDRYTTRTT